MFGLPSTWLIGGLMLARAATWGTMKIKHASEVTASYEKGVNAGKAASRLHPIHGGNRSRGMSSTPRRSRGSGD